MELTKKQLEGLEIALERFSLGEKYTVISGYAGTGKSTLVKFIIEALKACGVSGDDVVYCAYTGKATEVLKKKGNPNTCTLHRLLYHAQKRADGKFVFRPRKNIDYRIVVVDEASMVPASMVKLLMSYPCYIIFCGDPAQLPPIDKGEDNHLLEDPHVFLDEIMRQALDSEIITLSMKIRESKPIGFFRGQDSMVLTEGELNTGVLQWADMVLCGTNKKRVLINNQIRELKGYDVPCVEGEKVMCLKNNWNLFSDKETALTNGCVGTLHNIREQILYPPSFLHIDPFTVITADFISEEGEDFGSINIDKKLFLTGESSLTNRQLYILNREKMNWLIPEQFTYGYCATVWKAQGSEWDRVLVIEERFPFDSLEHKQFLYTAVTRAAKKVILIR